MGEGGIKNGQKNSNALGAIHKRRRIFWAIFHTPLPHVGILTLIYLTSNF